jgi:transposase-like protein
VDKTQDSKRRHFSPHEKVAAVKRHLLEHMPISAICEELEIAPNMFYRWQQALFENAHRSFETDRKSKAIEATKDRKTSPALKGWAPLGSPGKSVLQMRSPTRCSTNGRGSLAPEAVA